MSKIIGMYATIYFSRETEGGRHSPIFSGYRPAFWFGPGLHSFNDGTIFLMDLQEGTPGKEYNVRVEFLVPDAIPDTVQPGVRFTAQEGGRVIGRGIVKQVIFSRD